MCRLLVISYNTTYTGLVCDQNAPISNGVKLIYTGAGGALEPLDAHQWPNKLCLLQISCSASGSWCFNTGSHTCAQALASTSPTALR